MGDLAKFAQKNSPYLKIPDNDEVEVIYLGYEEVEDQRNPGKTKIRYTVDVDGEEKWFESSSAGIAMTLDQVKEGERIVIKRAVASGKIRYAVEPVQDK